MLWRTRLGLGALLLGLAGCANSDPFVFHNPAVPKFSPCIPAKVFFSGNALTLHNSQEFLRSTMEIDLLRDTLTANFSALLSEQGQVEILGDSAWNRQEWTSRPWPDNLWFRAHWPIYRKLDDSKLQLFIQRMDLGQNLNPKLLYAGNNQSTEEGEVDTLLGSQRTWPKVLDLWTCWTLWDGPKAQYQSYGCFKTQVSKTGNTAWDRDLDRSEIWQNWSKQLRQEICK